MPPCRACPDARLILVHDSPGERRIALVLEHLLTEFAIHRPGAPDGIGDLHLARVIARIPAMAGAFLALHDAEAFLPDTQGADTLTEGDLVRVRITRAAQGGKGPRVTALTGPAAPPDDAPPPAGPVRLLQRGPSPLDELQAAYPAETVHHAPFDDALEAQIDALANPHALLEGGMRAIFSITPALTAIDLDSAQATANRTPKATAQMNANRQALPSLVRQIALRNLSGAVLVDFAGIPTRKRRALAPALEAALAADRLHPTLAGFSNLGFAEITRPRHRPPLHELLTSPLGIGLAALRHAAREAQAAPARRWCLRAPMSVVNALQKETAALATLARSSTYPLVLRGDSALIHDCFLEDAAMPPTEDNGA